MFHAINWGYLMKCVFVGLGAAALVVAPLVEGYLWLLGVI